jgi:alpha-ketoglutarate-dependent taurine dioxygenase
MFKFILLLISFNLNNSYRIIQHPIESRCVYVNGLDLLNPTQKELYNIKKLFEKKPLLVFRNNLNSPLNPQQFIHFLTNFDHNYDQDALINPEQNMKQMLQPFDKIPNSNHVAPRGNFENNNLFGIPNLSVKPFEPFINNYLWHTDILGHESKLPGVITGFNIIDNPLIGGDTDFISGERVWENLSLELQNACRNIIVKINRNNFAFGKKMDYAGINAIDNSYKKFDDNDVYIPIVYNDYSNPSVLVMPSFFENIKGLDKEESDIWIKHFMKNHVLPYRFSIQWQKNDVCVFANRKFMHSSTPARNYLDFKESSSRLLLQTFLPTKEPLKAIKPITEDDIIYNVKWANTLYNSKKAHGYARSFYLNKVIENKLENFNLSNNEEYILKHL